MPLDAAEGEAPDVSRSGVWFVLVLTTFACRAGTSAEARDVRLARGSAEGSRPLTQIEMQESIERFTGEFLDRITQSLETASEGQTPEVQREVLRRVLVYSSAILDIASGPLPEVNALDLVVFVRLSRKVFERHWLPEVFGERARPMLESLMTSEQRAWDLAGRVLSEKQLHELASLIDDWERAHPEQIRVEAVRLQQFAEHAGRVADERRRDASGLLGSVRSATQAADRALLLGERAMFLAHRMPFLLRLQTRLGAQEVLSDSVQNLGTQIGGWEQALDYAEQSRPLVQDLSQLTHDSLGAAREARLALEALEPLLRALPPVGELKETLETSHRLADKSLAMLRELRALAPEDPERALTRLEARADRWMRRLMLHLAGLGGALIVLFWGGYYVVRRASAAFDE
ncbi:MAG TPA: hypothetical protein VIM73_14150 [Polyangiaceae bacterium]